MLAAEALGFDLVFALSQWLSESGYGDVFNGDALDAFVTPAAVTAVTRRIMLISTIHLLYGPLHPLRLAKYAATLDHVSRGGWGALHCVRHHGRPAVHSPAGSAAEDHFTLSSITTP